MVHSSSFEARLARPKSTLIDYGFLFFYSIFLVLLARDIYPTRHHLRGLSAELGAEGLSERCQHAFDAEQGVFVGCGFQDWDNWSIRSGMQASQLRRQTK